MPVDRGALWGLGAAAALGAGAAIAIRRRDAAAFDALAAALRRAPDSGAAPALRELVRCATLAPNSHNTQPWRFVAEGNGLRVLPDPARRTPVVDPDDHHLFASLGCAVETMVQATPALGLRAEPEAAADGGAVVHLAAAPVQPGAMAAAIARRRSTRARAAMAELVLAGNSVQLRDAAFVAELASWIRFSHGEALARRDGLFAGSSGNPVLPAPLGRRLFPRVFTLAAETDRMARQLAGSAGFAVFAAARDDPAHWLAAGRAAQRLCLVATALGLSTAWVNQPVEVPALRPVLAAWLGLGGRRPDLVLRFGRGPVLPPSLRRPVEEVLVERNA